MPERTIVIEQDAKDLEDAMRVRALKAALERLDAPPAQDPALPNPLPHVGSDPTAGAQTNQELLKRLFGE